MKKRNSIRQGLSLGTIIALVATTLLFSCKRNSINADLVKTSMTDIASIVSGGLTTGKVTVENDKDELVLNVNNGNKYILISKIPNSKIANINDVRSADVITSKYGIILKDLSNNKIFFLTNNDSESIKKFEALQSLFWGDVQSDKIFGTTIVNSEKS